MTTKYFIDVSLASGSVSVPTDEERAVASRVLATMPGSNATTLNLACLKKDAAVRYARTLVLGKRRAAECGGPPKKKAKTFKKRK